MNILWCRGGGTLFQQAPQRSFYLLKYFPDEYNITVYNFGCDYFYGGFLKKPRKYRFKKNIIVFEPINVNIFPMNRYYHLNDFLPSLHTLFAGLLESFNADIIVGVGFWGGIAGALLSKIADTPFIYDYTDPYTELSGLGPFRVYYSIERFLPRASDLTVCVSYTLYDKAKSYGAKRIEIIPNGFEPERFTLKNRSKSQCFPIGKKIVLYVGQVNRSYGFDIFIESALYVPDNILYVIVGSGPGAREVRALVENLHLNNKIKFIGYQPSERIPELINSSDVCIVPYSRESSIKLLEYGALGKPVVTFEGNVERRFAKDKEIIISRWNPVDLAKSIKYLITNKKRQTL